MDPRKNLRRGGPGRHKGIPNKVTRDVRAAATLLVNDKRYRAALRRRLIAGTAGQLESVLWYYAYGKPRETHEVTGADGGPLAGPIVIDDGKRAELTRRLAERAERQRYMLEATRGRITDTARNSTAAGAEKPEP